MTPRPVALLESIPEQAAYPGAVVVNVTVEPALADKETACLILAGIAQRTLMQLVEQGQLNARKLGSRTVFEVDELRRFAASLPSWEPKDVP